MPKEKPVANAYFVERELVVTFTNGDQIILRRNQFKELRRGLNALNKKLEAEKPKPAFVLQEPMQDNNYKWKILDARHGGQALDAEFEGTPRGAAMAAWLMRELNREDRKRNTVTPGFKEI